MGDIRPQASVMIRDVSSAGLLAMACLPVPCTIFRLAGYADGHNS
jgi:hypothetical protein